MIARWTVHISMCSAWIVALAVAALGDRPVEILAASVFIVLVPFVWIAMAEELQD